MSILELINIKYHYKLKLIMFLLIAIIFMVYMLDKSFCDIYVTKGYAYDNLLNINLRIDDREILNNIKYIKIDNKRYEFRIESISDYMLDEVFMDNYQVVKIKINASFIDNQVVSMSIFYNEEKGYEKLKKLLL